MDTRVGTHTELLLAARTAHVRRDWHASYEGFVRAGEDTPLCTDDLDALAVAAWQLGRGKESVRVAERVFAQLSRTDPPSAAMKAVELALAWFTRGDLNIAQGWMNRARRLLDGAPESPTHGYLAYLDTAVAVFSEDSDVLADRLRKLREIGGRLDVPAVTALCRVAEALGAILDARTSEAFGLLDEALLPVLPVRFRSNGRATSTAPWCTTAIVWATCPGCAPGLNRWSAGATISPHRQPMAASAMCTACNCWPRPTTTA